jgi:transcriptional regulator with XRE-family HTH domain/quercetin dioxygenase-like cupin family protein
MRNHLPAEQLNSEINVGRRLRDLRTERGLSIRVLAEQSGLNVNTLSLIENGKTSPSVSTLQEIAGALRVPVTTFFQVEAPAQSIVYQKAGERRSATFACGSLANLATGFAVSGLQPFVVTMAPKAGSGSRSIVHTGLELVFCLAGQILYQVDGQDFQLDPGDSLLFEAHLPHSWQNNCDGPSQSLMLICSADEHDRPDERHFS